MAFVPSVNITKFSTGNTAALSVKRSLSGHAFPKRSKSIIMVADDLEDDYVFDENKPLLMSDLKEGVPKVPGFTDYSELLNGRAAMIGFIATLAIEAFTGRGLLSIVSDVMGKS